jgi:hypothetical protein
MMYVHKLAAAAGFACGAAMALAPFASADASSDWLSSVDGFLSGLPAAPTAINLDISFDGYTLYDGMGTATATTLPGQFGFAIAYGDHATAIAEGGTGNYALADGTYALAKAGSTAANATGFNYNTAEDIGNNVNPSTYPGAPDGAYAGGGSLIGNTDAAGTLASSHNSAFDIGNNGVSTGPFPPGTGDGGNSGAFAGDSGLIGYNHVAGNGDTAYTNGNLNGFGDGSAAVGGNNDFASSTGTETGTNEGAFAGFGDNNQAIADTNYTTSGDGVSATFGNGNYAYVLGPNNSTADAGGTAAHLGNNNISYVYDPFSGATATASSADAGSSGTASGNSDLAEVLLTHGNASATGANNLYDILTPFGPIHSASLPGAATAAADPAVVPATDPLASTVASEVASMNALFQTEAFFAGVPSTDYSVGPQGFDIVNVAAVPTVQDGGTTPLDYMLYGVDPVKAGLATDPGAFTEFNGALVNFDDAFNTGLYALFNNGDLITGASAANDLFGSATSISEALATGTATSAITDFLTDGYNDLLGYFGIFTS